MKLFRIFILAFFSIALIACGGAEERKSVYMEKAKSSIAAGDFDKARIELKNVLQIDPKDDEAYYQLGKVYEAQKEYRKAYTHYLKVEKLNPDNLANQAQLGRFYMLLANDDEKAQQKVDLILSKDPQNLDGLLLKSALLHKNKKLKEAIAIAKKVVDKDIAYVEGVTFLATLYYKDERPLQAIKLLDEALKVSLDNKSLSKLLAAILVKEKNYKRAEVIYKNFLEKNPDSRNSYNILAQFYDTSGNEEKSIEVLQSSINNAPEDAERYLVLVKYIKLKKGNDAAISKLKTFVNSNEGMEKLRVALAELLLMSGDKELAIDVYKKIINDFPEEVSGVEARISLASIYIIDKDIAQASEIIDDALKVSPNDPKVNFLRSKVALFNKDVETAIISLRIVTKEMPENIDAFFLLASAYQLEGNKEQVNSTLNSAYENNKTNPAALLKLAKYYLTNNIDLSQKIIGDYNNLKKSDYDGMVISAMILNKKKLYPEAYVIAEKLIELFPDKSAGYFHAVPYLLQQDKKQKAISVLEQGYKSTRDNRTLLALLTKLEVSDEQFDVAITRIKDELKVFPADSSLKLMLAKVYILKKDSSSAESILNDVVKTEPASEEAYLLLAQIYQKQKDVNSVKSILKEGKSNVVSSMQIPLRLALAYEFSNEYSEAIKVYRELNELYPDNLAIINNLISMLSDYGEKSDLALAEKLAMKLEDSKQYVFKDTVGWLHYKLGDYESAIKYISQAEEKAPEVNVFNYHLGMAYKKNGDKAQARKYLEKSMADGKNFKEKEQAKAALKGL